MSNNERIVFMGTPEFAVATLNALVADGQEIAAVVTAPDRPAGRGRQVRASAVKERALELGLPILQPEKLKAPEFLAELDRIDAALFVVVAFRMLPEVVWSKPRLGTVNLHGSLLPAYRGAAPINWAVINGETRSGVTTFLIRQAIDTGDILLQEATSIGTDETAGDLHDRLMEIGAQLMVRTVHALFEDAITPTPQRSDPMHPAPSAPKLDPDNTHVHFDRAACTAHDHVRGLSPFPGAWCRWTDAHGHAQQAKLLRTRLTGERATEPPGALTMREGRLYVHCNDHMLEIVDLQLEGRKRMPAADLLRGLRAIEGTVLT